MLKTFIGVGVVAFAAASVTADIVKPPDVGPWWNPIDGISGTYVYASDFVMEGTDLNVDALGMWLELLGGTSQSIRFEIWGDNGGPDPFNVLSTTGSVTPNVVPSLDYFEYPASSATLVVGDRYWFAATVVGEGGGATFRTGGHTQNSVYNDNGTFWYSNDPAGINFDGQGLTPQMAFAVSLVPAPASAGLLGLAGLVGLRRRR